MPWCCCTAPVLYVHYNISLLLWNSHSNISAVFKAMLHHLAYMSTLTMWRCVIFQSRRENGRTYCYRGRDKRHKVPWTNRWDRKAVQGVCHGSMAILCLHLLLWLIVVWDCIEFSLRLIIFWKHLSSLIQTRLWETLYYVYKTTCLRSTKQKIEYDIYVFDMFVKWLWICFCSEAGVEIDSLWIC